MQPNEITLANMGQVARANAAKQDANLQGSTGAAPGQQPPGIPLTGGAPGLQAPGVSLKGAAVVDPGPAAPNAIATAAPTNGIIAGQMMAGKRA